MINEKASKLPMNKIQLWVKIVRERPSAYEKKMAAMHPLSDAFAVASLLRERISKETVECFYSIPLDIKNRPLALEEISRGGVAGAQVAAKEVFRTAVMIGASSLIVAHNHPSGDPTPSEQDKILTKALVDAGKILGVPVYDHLVLSIGRFYSFAEEGERMYA